jgi:hypothetical protein
MSPRPCIGCSALVIGGASVYRGLYVVEKCQIFLQGIKSSELYLFPSLMQMNQVSVVMHKFIYYQRVMKLE